MGRFTLTKLLAVTGALMLGAPLLLGPLLRDARIRENEDCAQRALAAIAAAEDAFAREDRDRNGKADFWTADVAGLHAQGLLPREVAEAEAGRPYHGYRLAAIPYRHHESWKWPREGYAFCAFPARPGRTGRRTYVITPDSGLEALEHTQGPLSVWPLHHFCKGCD